MADAGRSRGTAGATYVPGIPEEKFKSKSDVKDHAARKAAADRSFGHRSLVRAWKEQQDADRKMREVYARRLIWLLVGQVAGINAFFLLMGWRVLGFVIEPWTARTFVVTAFLEVASLVLIVAKYLFPPPSDRALEMIGQLNTSEARARSKSAARKTAKSPRPS